MSNKRSYLTQYKTAVWKRKIDPRSKIAMIGVPYLLIFAFWNNSFFGALLIIGVSFTTPFWFPEAKKPYRWLTEATEGEKFWVDHATSGQRIGVGVSAGFILLFLILSLWNHSAFFSVLFLMMISVYKAIFLMFAHNIYEDYRSNEDKS